MTAKTAPAFYTIAEACARLGVSRATIGRRLAAGQLTRIELPTGTAKPGDREKPRVRIPRAEIEAIVEGKPRPARRRRA